MLLRLNIGFTKFVITIFLMGVFLFFLNMQMCKLEPQNLQEINIWKMVWLFMDQSLWLYHLLNVWIIPFVFEKYQTFLSLGAAYDLVHSCNFFWGERKGNVCHLLLSSLFVFLSLHSFVYFLIFHLSVYRCHLYIFFFCMCTVIGIVLVLVLFDLLYNL